jgi:hypothetical protein
MRPEASTRRWGAAVGLSLLLHALALSWWWGAARRPLHAMPGAAFQAPAGRAPAMVWIATSPPLASAAASATPLAQLAGPQPAPSVRTAPARKKQAVAVPALAATVTAPPAAAPQAAAPTGRARAAGPRLPSLPGPCVGGRKTCAAQQAAPVRRSASRRALFRTNAGQPTPQATAQRGGDMRLTEQYGAGGVRVTRVCNAVRRCIAWRRLLPTSRLPWVRRRASCCRATAPEQHRHGLHRPRALDAIDLIAICACFMSHSGAKALHPHS